MVLLLRNLRILIFGKPITKSLSPHTTYAITNRQKTIIKQGAKTIGETGFSAGHLTAEPATFPKGRSGQTELR